MNKIYFQKPLYSNIKQIKVYQDYCYNSDKYMHGTNQLLNSYDIKKWIDWTNSLCLNDICPDDYVCAEHYLCFDEQTNILIGMVNIRYSLNYCLSVTGGNIKFSLIDNYYIEDCVSQIIKFSLQKCFEHGLNKIVIFVDNNDNILSDYLYVNNAIYEKNVYCEKSQLNYKKYIIDKSYKNKFSLMCDYLMLYLKNKYNVKNDNINKYIVTYLLFVLSQNDSVFLMISIDNLAKQIYEYATKTII